MVSITRGFQAVLDHGLSFRVLMLSSVSGSVAFHVQFFNLFAHIDSQIISVLALFENEIACPIPF